MAVERENSTTAPLYEDAVFAPLDHDHQLERIGGGNETEVYCSDDRRYVVKLKSDLGGSVAQAVAHARTMRAAAEEFAASLGPEHSIASYCLLSRDRHGLAQVLVVQPFVEHARPLAKVDYAALTPAQRRAVGLQLRAIIARALIFYRRYGHMPDLYGRSNANTAERHRSRSIWDLPHRMWSFLIERSLLCSHNLLLTDAPECRVVLIDYDFVRRSALYRRVYYTVRWYLFWRDRILIQRMERTS